MVSIDDLYKLCNWGFQRTIIGSIKSKMAEIRHLKN